MFIKARKIFERIGILLNELNVSGKDFTGLQVFVGEKAEKSIDEKKYLEFNYNVNKTGDGFLL